MRTNIVIDDRLMDEAVAVAGLPSKRATVEAGLRLLIRSERQKQAFASLAGIGWEGDLKAMRQGRELPGLNGAD